MLGRQSSKTKLDALTGGIGSVGSRETSLLSVHQFPSTVAQPITARDVAPTLDRAVISDGVATAAQCAVTLLWRIFRDTWRNGKRSTEMCIIGRHEWWPPCTSSSGERKARNLKVGSNPSNYYVGSNPTVSPFSQHLDHANFQCAVRTFRRGGCWHFDGKLDRMTTKD